MGDGEMDEPESMGAIGMAAREGLDNLVFVVNCNLQRLDGPVRGNGKIIQELETNFRGAGWNVIKVIWGSYWDPLLARDKDGILLKRMEEAVDGEYQKFKSRDGAYVREHFFGKYPRAEGDGRQHVRRGHLAPEPRRPRPAQDLRGLPRGGEPPRPADRRSSPRRSRATAWARSARARTSPTSRRRCRSRSLRQFRDRFAIPIGDDQLGELPYFKPADNSPEMKYMRERRAKLGGSIPQRRRRTMSLDAPKLETFKTLLEATAEGREISTTMAFVRMLTALVRDKNIGRNVVPIVPDESRTFGMEGLFRQLGIYSSVGQLYEPEDSDQLMFYKEDKNGQILQEGINEAGAMCSWIAAATSYSTNNVPMIPFFIFYSMFGLQRVGDLVWAAGDMRARGFLLGGTAGRTTLNGEGLQHEDGHSHILSSTIPNCLSYDPTFAYEVAVIIQDGLRRMVEDQEDVFYYITVMNENYAHPALPEGAREGILKGHVPARRRGRHGQGPARAAARQRHDPARGDRRGRAAGGGLGRGRRRLELPELHRAAPRRPRGGALEPAAPDREAARSPTSSSASPATKGPVIASTDYVRAFADQIRAFVPRRYKVLGTDGFGRSDSRENLRRFFEVDRHYVAVAALKALAEDGEIPAAKVAEAITKYGIDAEKPAPWTV